MASDLNCVRSETPLTSLYLQKREKDGQGEEGVSEKKDKVFMLCWVRLDFNYSYIGVVGFMVVMVIDCCDFDTWSQWICTVGLAVGVG